MGGTGEALCPAYTHRAACPGSHRRKLIKIIKLDGGKRAQKKASFPRLCKKAIVGRVVGRATRVYVMLQIRQTEKGAER